MNPGCRALVLAGLVAALPALPAPAGPAVDPATLRLGEQIYTRCAACHAIGFNRTGPQHCGLFGRRAGTAPGFDNYSEAMRASRIVWDARSLDRFLQAPLQALPGTSMGYAGVKDPLERAALIAWLRQATRDGQSCSVSR
jgi:cytochrome c